MKTSSDLREFLGNLAISVKQGEIEMQKAAIAIKACKEINASIYSEIKTAKILNELGQEVALLGDLPLVKRKK